MKRTPIGVAGIALLVLAMAGCSAPAPEPTATIDEAAAEEAVGTTLDELQAMYVQAGGECEDVKPRVGSSVWKEAGDCDGGALLTTYRSRAQRDGAIEALEGLQDSNPSPHTIAVGPDWIVNGADAGEVATTMGGEAQEIGAD